MYLGAPTLNFMDIIYVPTYLLTNLLVHTRMYTVQCTGTVYSRQGKIWYVQKIENQNYR